MTFSKQTTGQKGEAAAIDYLKKRRYQILEQNFRCQFGEIDIITQKAGVLCFVEVKTRHDASHGSPAEAVTRYKQHKIIQTALYYLQQQDPGHNEMRFDVVTVDYDSHGKMMIDLIENAFETP
ncbi:MAG: YraN family protein [Candidatus Omnitrophica bacterium]|nr:YraN family protein [Candidatus Omnitrophota bacterium]